MDMVTDVAPAQVAAVRRFNRFHTLLVGALNEGLLQSPYSLPQVRVLLEVAHAGGIAATDLALRLRMDTGYLSRLVAGLEAEGLVRRTPDAADGRRLELRLTDAGRTAFDGLARASAAEVEALLAPLPPADRRHLVAAMARIERLLGAAATQAPFVLRGPEPGDMGWVVHRQAVLYAREYGWDWTFEALVAEIVAGFVKAHDPKRERCWIAEQEGQVVGSVFLVRGDETTAKLRLLYVEPRARGRGLGAHLVDECLRFAERVGYRRMTLWTNANLLAARRIYEAKGFRLVEESPHRSFGHDLIGQNWELDL